MVSRILPLVVALLGLPPAAVRAGSAADGALQRLGALRGEWQARTRGGSVVKTSYHLVSGDTALVETYTTASGRQTLTIFHADGPRLLATHYCAQGNQPRLRLDGSGGGARLIFRFQDATNLARPTDAHLHRLELDLVDADHFTRRETYLADGKEDTEVLQYVRVR